MMGNGVLRYYNKECRMKQREDGFQSGVIDESGVGVIGMTRGGIVVVDLGRAGLMMMIK
jgi:hypothetical protein